MNKAVDSRLSEIWRNGSRIDWRSAHDAMGIWRGIDPRAGEATILGSAAAGALVICAGLALGLWAVAAFGLALGIFSAGNATWMLFLRRARVGAWIKLDEGAQVWRQWAEGVREAGALDALNMELAVCARLRPSNVVRSTLEASRAGRARGMRSETARKRHPGSAWCLKWALRLAPKHGQAMVAETAHASEIESSDAVSLGWAYFPGAMASAMAAAGAKSGRAGTHEEQLGRRTS